jgi:hypothetical protein
MSDPAAEPDPMDKAYVQAEAVLDDDAARAARRARVLAAVARESAPEPARSGASRRPAWRHTRWLAAAGVAGLIALVANQIYEPAWRHPPSAPRVAATPSSAAPQIAALPPAAAVSEAPPPSAAAAASQVSTRELAPSAPPPPPPTIAAPALEAFPKAVTPPPPPPPSSSDATVVTAERRDETIQKAPVAISAFTGQSRAVEPVEVGSLASSSSEQAARLREDAAAGRTADLDTLLAQGVPVDAPDARGETALMKSVAAGQSAAAALLRRHGASLDRKDHAGESARDMAKAKDDAALNQALGLGP